MTALAAAPRVRTKPAAKDLAVAERAGLQDIDLSIALRNLRLMRLLERIRDELADVSVVEHMPKLEGRQMIMVLAPKRKQ